MGMQELMTEFEVLSYDDFNEFLSTILFPFRNFLLCSFEAFVLREDPCSFARARSFRGFISPSKNVTSLTLCLVLNGNKNDNGNGKKVCLVGTLE